MALRPGQQSEAEKQALLARGREFVLDVRKRVNETPPEEMKRIVNDTVDEVRRRQAK